MCESQFPPLEKLLPHRGAAILLSRVLEFQDEYCVCETVVERTMQYVVAGKADAALAVELMAQTVSVFVALQGQSNGSQSEPQVGYVVGVPKMQFWGGDYKEGTRLRISARVVFHEGPVGRFDVLVEEGSERRAQGALTVFEPPDDELPVPSDE